MRARLVSSLIIVPAVIFGLSLFILSRLSVEELIICSADGKSFSIPQGVCEAYLNSIAGKQHAQDLDKRAGLSFAFEIEGSSKYEIIDRLLDIGVEINSVSKVDGLTPLNSAILLNDYKLVKYLLKHGADIYKEDMAHQMNAKEYVNLLIREDPQVDRERIHALIFRESEGAESA